MPTFFNKDTLTPEQAARYESACKDYEVIQNNNAKVQFESLNKAQLQKLRLQLKAKDDKEVQEHFLTMIKLHHPDTKSALFFRLLNNQKPLLYPPPCSYSYPWYNIIEDDKPQEIHPDCNKLDDFPSYHKNSITIEQTSWEVLEKKSDTEAIVSFGMWKNVGFKWLLQKSKISCKDSTMKIAAHHNDNLVSITTLEELYKEQEYHVLSDLKKINLILHPDTQEAHKQFYIEKYGQGFAQGLFDTELSGAKYMLQQRRNKGLTDYPTDDEIKVLIEDKVQGYLNRDITHDEQGNLYILSWTLTKITPEVLPNIYLEM